MTRAAELFDTVALLRDFPQHNVGRGDVGAVVEVYPDAYEVEFVDADGAPRAMFAVPRDDCLPVHLGPLPSAVSGVVNGSLWYWYDAAEDLLDVRLVSQRSSPGSPDPAPEGFTLLRDPVSGAAIGMVIRGFWARFGDSEEPPDRVLIEQQVSGLAARLAA